MGPIPRPKWASVRDRTLEFHGEQCRVVRGLPQDWGYGRQEGISRVCGLTRSGRVSWILRLVKTGAECEGRATDVMEIDRPDDLGDVANLGLTLSEAKQLLAA